MWWNYPDHNTEGKQMKIMKKRVMAQWNVGSSPANNNSKSGGKKEQTTGS